MTYSEKTSYGVSACCRQACVWLVLCEHMPMPQSYCAPVMAPKRGKRRIRGRRLHRRSPAAAAWRRMRGEDRLGRALRGPVHHVLLASAVKIFFQVDIPEAISRGTCTESLPRLSAPRAPPISSRQATTTCARTFGAWCMSWAPCFWPRPRNPLPWDHLVSPLPGDANRNQPRLWPGAPPG